MDTTASLTLTVRARLVAAAATTAAVIAATVGPAPTSAAQSASVSDSSVSVSTMAAKAAAGKRTDRPWSGFGIRAGNNAGGRFIGARKANGRVVYRIDPRASANPGPGFGPVRKVTRVPGPGKRKNFATPSQTSRAAWILSKYGAVRYDIQSAAADAAVLHLLHRRAYKLGRALGKNRVKQTRNRKAVVRFARFMIRQSRRQAGPYRVKISTAGQAVRGGSERVTVTVTSKRSGRGLGEVPVRMTGDGGTVKAGLTNSAGQVTENVATPQAGERPIQVTVGNTPESRLLLRSPRRSAGSRVAVAGVKRVLRADGILQVKAIPSVRVVAKNAKVTVGQFATGTYTLTGGAGDDSRKAVIRLHGPFNTGNGASCERNANTSRTVQLRSNGTYKLPTYKLTRTGYYLWSVKVSGNAVNQATDTCGAKTYAKPKS